MDIKEKAKLYAIKHHLGQVRKSEPDKPMIIHPIMVGQLLEASGYDDNVIAAGYLHDVVEDTDRSIDDINNVFNIDIAHLVMSASEPDKSLPWEERKHHTIESIKSMPLRNKAIVCADKIANLEELKNHFKKEDYQDFSFFNRGYDDQKWYYTQIYNSLIYNEDENNPLFIRLKKAIAAVFEKPIEDPFLADVIFEGHIEELDSLKKLHAKKEELKQLRDALGFNSPFVIEFTGTPRTGKTTLINNLYDFFKKGGFKIKIIKEFTSSYEYKEVFYPAIAGISKYEHNILVAKEIERQLDAEISKENDIIIMDRSMFDRLIWMDILLNKNKMTSAQYDEYVEYYKTKINDLINIVVINYATALTALKRDYSAHLSLEKRRFLNEDNLNNYNNSLNNCQALLDDDKCHIYKIDTEYITQRESSIAVANEILPLMREEYIKRLKTLI